MPCSPCREYAEKTEKTMEVPFAFVRMVNAFCRVPLVATPLHNVEARNMASEGVAKLHGTGSFCGELVSISG